MNAIELRRNEEVDLHQRCKDLEFQVNWTTNQTNTPHLSCVIIDKLGSVVDVVTDEVTASEDGNVFKTESLGVDSAVHINLHKLNCGVKAIAFIVSVERGSLKQAKTIGATLLDRMNKYQYVLVDNNVDASPLEGGYIVSVLFKSDSVKRGWVIQPLLQKVEGSDYIPTLTSTLRTHNIVRENYPDGITLSQGEFFDFPDSANNVAVKMNWQGRVALAIQAAFFEVNDKHLAESNLSDRNDSIFNSAAVFEVLEPVVEEASTEYIVTLKLQELPANIYSILLTSIPQCPGKVLRPNLIIEDAESKNVLCKYELDHWSTDAKSYVVGRIYRHNNVFRNVHWRLCTHAKACSATKIDAIVSTLYKECPVSVLVPDRELELFIQAVEGKDLAAKDLNGFSDPYYKVYVNSALMLTSRYIMKTLNPKWSDSLETTLPATPDNIYHIRIEVWDYDKISADDSMGQVEFDLDLNASKSVTHSNWYPLSQRKDKNEFVSGSILVAIKAKSLSGTITQHRFGIDLS